MRMQFNNKDLDTDLREAISSGLFKEGTILNLCGYRKFKLVKVDKPGWFDPEWLTLQPASVIISKGKEHIGQPFGFHLLFMHGQMVDVQ